MDRFSQRTVSRNEPFLAIVGQTLAVERGSKRSKLETLLVHEYHEDGRAKAMVAIMITFFDQAIGLGSLKT